MTSSNLWRPDWCSSTVFFPVDNELIFFFHLLPRRTRSLIPYLTFGREEEIENTVRDISLKIDSHQNQHSTECAYVITAKCRSPHPLPISNLHTHLFIISPILCKLKYTLTLTGNSRVLIVCELDLCGILAKCGFAFLLMGASRRSWARMSSDLVVSSAIVMATVHITVQLIAVFTSRMHVVILLC